MRTRSPRPVPAALVTTRHAMRRALLAVASAGLALALPALGARAASPSATAGLDRFASSDGVETRAFLGLVAVPVARGDVIAGAMRLESSEGDGFAWVAGGGAPLAGAAQIRVLATLVSRSEAASGWRLQAGPRLTSARGASLALSYTRDANEDEPAFHGALAEASMPIAQALSARAALGFAASSAAASGGRASAGIVWSPLRHLELALDLGVARSSIASTGGPLPSATPGGSPLGGLALASALPRSSGAEGASGTTTTTLLGIRFPFP